MRTITLCLLLVRLAGAYSAYYIGNSLTDCIHYHSFEQAVEQMEEQLDWGRHMVPGAPLDWEVAAIIQNTAWEVVSTNELCGITEGTSTRRSADRRPYEAAVCGLSSPHASPFALNGRRLGLRRSSAVPRGTILLRAANGSVSVLPAAR